MVINRPARRRDPPGTRGNRSRAEDVKVLLRIQYSKASELYAMHAMHIVDYDISTRGFTEASWMVGVANQLLHSLPLRGTTVFQNCTLDDTRHHSPRYTIVAGAFSMRVFFPLKRLSNRSGQSMAQIRDWLCKLFIYTRKTIKGN